MWNAQVEQIFLTNQKQRFSKRRTSCQARLFSPRIIETCRVELVNLLLATSLFLEQEESDPHGTVSQKGPIFRTLFAFRRCYETILVFCNSFQSLPFLLRAFES